MYLHIAILVSLIKLGECQYGSAELLENSYQLRRSRLLSDFSDDKSRSGFVSSNPLSLSRSLPVTQEPTDQTDQTTILPTLDEDKGATPTADALKKYARIFKMDTENLNEKQKMLLQRIVQRIARLNGVQLDEQTTDSSDNNEGRARYRKKTQKKPSNATTETSSPISTKTNKQKITNAQPNHDIQMKKVTASNVATTFQTTVDFTTAPTTPSKIGKNKVTQANISTFSQSPSGMDLGNISTTSIVNILSTDNARENFFVRRPAVTATHHQHAPQQQHQQLHQQKQQQQPLQKVPQKPQSIKPTKYHFYPHNQHIYMLPECAIQQVCNAVYVRLNYTQPLCACPARYRDPCSASINEDDLHTTKLIGDPQRRAITLAKTCEPTTEMRECRSPRDWSLLALQNIRTGKSHYLVICRCPDSYNLEGPMAHDQPTYASVPGIRVFGMMCNKPDDGVVSHGIQRPAPPKRNQYFQAQSSYYQRFKKHTLSKLTAQQKTNGEQSVPPSSLSSSLNSNNNIQSPTQQSAELSSSDFTTRGINIVSGQPAENREDEDESNESSKEISSSTYDSLSSSYGTTTDTIDALPTDSIATSVSRGKRTIEISNHFDSAESDDELDEMDGNGGTFSESSRLNKNNNDDDWPSIAWDEISQQIQDIQWD